MPQKCPPQTQNLQHQRFTRYRAIKWIQILKTKKKFSGKKLNSLHYDQKNTLNPLVKSVFKSVHNYGRYLQFCDRRVCSFHHVATRRLYNYMRVADTSH